MPDVFVFSSVKARVGAVGATLSDTDDIGPVQDFVPSVVFEEAMVRGATFNSQFPLADAQFDATVSATLNVTAWSPKILEAVTGLSGVSAGGFTTYTGTVTAKPVYRQVEFIGQTADGRQVKINFPRAKIKAFAPAFQRGDFQGLPVEVMSFPHASGTVYAPYIYSLAD